jgi:hypothetical protein
MALGIVYSIDPTDNTKGEIKENETEQIYPFVDPNFPTSGLGLNSNCTYDIDYSARTPTATNLAAYVPSEIIIDTPTAGPLTVNPGETMRVKTGGVVTGNVDIKNGNLFIEDTGVVNGDITVDQQGSFIARKGGKVTGNVNIMNGSAMKVVNKGRITGNVTITKANRFIIGNNVDGGTIIGSVTVDKIRKVTITPTSKINP